MKMLTLATLVASGISLVSLGLASKSGLALIVDQASGEQHCVDLLASLLGLQSFGAAARVANMASLMWLASVPLALLGAAAIAVRSRRSRRQSE